MSVHRNYSSKNMGLRDIGATLPPGFRFYPSDEELVCHYLNKKICNEQVSKGTLVEIDLHTCEPWQLPDIAKLNASEWYFFSFRDRKYATGYRTNRATASGYWKATGKDRTVMNPGTKDIVGMRKTLVFYRNRAPNGLKTGWIMHEFRLETPNMPPKEDWVLCRVFHKGKGAENSKEVQSPQHNLLLTEENVNYSYKCFPNSLSLIASSPTQTKDHQHQTLPNYGYRFEHMTSFNSSTSSHHDHDHNNNDHTPNGSHDHHDQKLGTINHRSNTINAGNNIPGTDDYGLLWDMNFDENGLENNVPSTNFDGIRFEISDNSMVFL